VTTALEPKTRTSRASGAMDAYRRVPLPRSWRNSALVFWAPSVWVVGVGKIGGEEKREPAGISMHHGREPPILDRKHLSDGLAIDLCCGRKRPQHAQIKEHKTRFQGAQTWSPSPPAPYSFGVSSSWYGG